jgi:hypothetical protein
MNTNKILAATHGAHMMTIHTNASIWIAVETMAAEYSVPAKCIYKTLETMYPDLYGDKFSWRF